MSLRTAILLDAREVMTRTVLLRLEAPEIAHGGRPGQFVMVRCAEEGSLDPFLRRPLALHRIDRVRGEVDLLVRVVGHGTAWLALRRPGDAIELLGPLGQGFSLDPRTGNLLLLAGGMGIAPLRAMADEAIERDCAVVLVLGARSAGELYPAPLLPAAVELHLSTDDGTAGTCGLAIDLLADPDLGLLSWADQVMACGPRPLLRCLADVVQANRLHWRRGFAQVSLEERMACGVGACLGCVVATRTGYQQVCRDGPVFDLRDLVWE